MSDKKVLVVDDELRMRRLVCDFLKKDGFHTIEAEDGEKALTLFAENPDIDLILLDVMMPKYDGWVVCREIRKTSQIPIIMLTAKGEEFDELLGFDLGADEYITKPFSLKILAARIQSLFRRLENESCSIRDFDGLDIDEQARYVYVNDEKIDLSPKEFELLVYLADNVGRALTRDQILNAVWSFDYYGDARTVDTHIKKLRLKLGPKSEYIQTVRSLGYRFEVNK